MMKVCLVLASIMLLCLSASTQPVAHDRAITIPSDPTSLLPAKIQLLSALGEPIEERRDAEHVPGEVIARFQSGVINLGQGEVGSLANVADEDLKVLLQTHGLIEISRVFKNAKPYPEEVISRTGEIVRLNNVWDVYLLRFPPELDVWEMIDSLRNYPQCMYAEPNGIVRSFAVPNDPRFGDQWNMERIDIQRAWDYETGASSVLVGILDTGIDYMHEEFGRGFGQGYKVGGGWDYVNNDNNPMDDCDYSHGTHVAGIVGAYTNNAKGVAGIVGGWVSQNFGCPLYALKVLDAQGGGTSDCLAQAISRAYSDFGIHVLNASLGGHSRSETLRGAILDAHKCGVVFVAAKGNEGSSEYTYPADFDPDWVISVGASNDSTRQDERRVHTRDNYYWSSNYGNGMDVLAPGVKILSTIRSTNSDPYERMEGTSMAAPHVAGLAALLLSELPCIPTDDVEGFICASCKDIDNDKDGGYNLIGYDQWSGWGRVCADSLIIFTKPQLGYVYDHLTAGGGYSVGSTGTIKMVFYGDGPLATGVYFCKRYDVRCDVTYPQNYGTFPHVWGRGLNETTGWSAANPNYQVGFCMVVPGSQTQRGCQLRTFVYQVWDVAGRYLGWYPCRPEEVEFAYTTLAGIYPASVDNGDARVGGLTLRAPTPNPLREYTAIRLEVGKSAEVRVRIYDIGGRLVRDLMRGWVRAGEREVVWDGRDESGCMVSSGLYLCRVSVDGVDVTRKVVVLR